MINNLKIRGKWFFPSEPRRRITGTLEFNLGEDPSLELEGSFNGDDNLVNSPQIILGVSSDGREITLYKCYKKRARRSHLTEYNASVIFHGRHFRQLEDIQINELDLEFKNLSEWYNRNWLQYDDSDTSRRFSITPAEADRFVLASTSDYEISIFSLFGERNSLEEVAIFRICRIRVVFNERVSFDGFFKMMTIIQNFLGFAMNESPYPTSITVRQGRFSSVIRRSNNDIRIFFNPLLPHTEKTILSHQMLFTLEEVRQNTQALENWINRSEVLEPVFTLYFSISHSPFMYSETRFLYLTQALETYHRNVFGGKYMEDDEFLNGLYRTLVNALPSNIDSDFRASLVRGKFRYANEYSLRKRLSNLLTEMNDYIPGPMFRNREQKDMFIADVTGNRNYLTHYDDSALDGIENRSSLFMLEQRLKLLLEAVFLREMGFSADTTRGFLNRSRSFRLIQQNSRR